jgi:hypothetical protein
MISVTNIKIQPLRGWWKRLFINPTFHAGLIRFNPFGIWFSDIIVKVSYAKSLKDLNICNPECNSGYKEEISDNPEGVE